MKSGAGCDSGGVGVGLVGGYWGWRKLALVASLHSQPAASQKKTSATSHEVSEGLASRQHRPPLAVYKALIVTFIRFIDKTAPRSGTHYRNA